MPREGFLRKTHLQRDKLCILKSLTTKHIKIKVQGRITSSKEEHRAHSWIWHKNYTADNDTKKISDAKYEDSAQVQLLMTFPRPLHAKHDSLGENAFSPMYYTDTNLILQEKLLSIYLFCPQHMECYLAHSRVRRPYEASFLSPVNCPSPSTAPKPHNFWPTGNRYNGAKIITTVRICVCII